MKTEPYLALEGKNCWTLVAQAYLDELGIELPLYENMVIGLAIHLDPERQQAIEKIWPSERDVLWVPIEDGAERQFDVVDMRVLGQSHVGLVLDPPQMLHQMAHKPMVANYRKRNWTHRVRGFFRHPSML